MGRRLIFDTTVLIDFERGRVSPGTFDDDDVAIAAISVAEYHTGVDLADTPVRATARARALEAITGTIEVLEYGEGTARHHGHLITHARRSGRPRGAHDLIIAAHALQTGRTLITRDAAARFGDLPGIRAEQP